MSQNVAEQSLEESEGEMASGWRLGIGKAEVGRLVDSGQADDRRVIRLVRERRLLYARNNMPVASYYSQVKGLWKEVADAMGWSVADVRRKWSHIRNSYSRHLRNEMHGTRTGKGRIVSKWYLAEELEFLREHMATDLRPSPFSSYPPTMVNLTEHTSAADSVELKPFLHSPSWFPLSSPHHSNVVEVKTEGAFATEDSSSSHAFAPDENSSYFEFFRGIYADYQELSAKHRRLFKRQCLTCLHALLDAEDAAPAREGPGPDDAVNLSHAMHDSADSTHSAHSADVKCILPNH